MNTPFRMPMAALSGALALILGSAAPSVLAAGRCDRPTVGGEARACAARQAGPEALRRFILRTETIYGLSYWDFQPNEVPVPGRSAQGWAPLRNADAMAMASNPGDR